MTLPPSILYTLYAYFRLDLLAFIIRTVPFAESLTLGSLFVSILTFF